MKKRTLIIPLFALAFTGCQDSEQSNNPSTNNTQTITVSINKGSDEFGTKISVSPDADNLIWELQWEDGDQLTGWSESGETSCFDMVELNAENADIASFTGDTKIGTMRLVYPYVTGSVSNSEFTIDLSEQTVDMSGETHNIFGDSYLYMISDSFDVDSTTEQIEHTPSMKHLMTAFELKIAVSDISQDDNYIISKATIKDIPSTASVKFSDTSITSTKGQIELTINGAQALESQVAQLIPFAAAPFTFTTTDTLTIDIELTNGKSFEITIGSPSSDVELAVGTHNTIIIPIAKSDIEFGSVVINDWLEGQANDDDIVII